MEKQNFNPSKIDWEDYYEQELFGNGWTPEQEEWEPMNGKEFTEDEIDDRKFDKKIEELEHDKDFWWKDKVEFNGSTYMFYKGFINTFITDYCQFYIDYGDTFFMVKGCTPLQYILHREGYERMTNKKRKELLRAIKDDLSIDDYYQIRKIIHAVMEFTHTETKQYKIVIRTDPYTARWKSGDWKFIDRFHAERVYEYGLTLEEAQKLLRKLYIDKSGDFFEQEVYDNMIKEDGTGGFEDDVYRYYIDEEDEEYLFD